ncbi:MAG: GAF domain-containing sensor histidine kinase [Taibaiella sp.]|nr:GAF domain-containing sensor histidine kinase [Taibaiella sp.]
MHIDELGRLRAVHRFTDPGFDLADGLRGLLQVAAAIFEVPVAFVTLLDSEDQWFVANHGFEVKRMPRATSFCTHAIQQSAPLIVPDATRDDRFVSNPLIIHPPKIKFYAGAPLTTFDGHNIGTICVMDVNTKVIVTEKTALLSTLARQAIYLMELELTQKQLQHQVNQVEVRNKTLMDIADIQSHEFRGPLSTVLGLMYLIKEDGYNANREYLELMEEAIGRLDDKIHLVVKSTEAIRISYSA